MMYTIDERLTTPFYDAVLEVLLQNTMRGGDVYTLLKDKNRDVYYLALNGSIFMLTVSPIVAFAIYNRATAM